MTTRIASLDELVARMDERFGDLGIDSLVMRPADQVDWERELGPLLGAPLPDSLVAVCETVCLAGVDIGLGFGPGSTSSEYATWVETMTETLRGHHPDFESALYVADSDPFYCLVRPSGVVYAVDRGAAPDTAISLSCSFEELVRGVATILLRRGRDDENDVRIEVAQTLGSPVRFWQAI